MRNRAEYKVIDGVLHKLCTGPAHRDGKMVPVSNYYPRSDAKNGLRNQCIDCEYVRKGAERNVKFTSQWWAWITEIVNRVGVREGMRQCGLSEAWFRWAKKNRPKTMHRSTARKILKALQELRKNEIVRHKDSIHHGAYLRGHEEKIPISRADYYKSHGDGDTDAQRRRQAAIRA